MDYVLKCSVEFIRNKPNEENNNSNKIMKKKVKNDVPALYTE